MSFKKSNNDENPVFDKPPQISAKGFFIRRLMSLAGKPVLAEKNLPIQPSKSESAEKCYVNRAASLYRQQSLAGSDQKFKPVICKYAVPQHNSFQHPERWGSEFNHISAYNPILKTVFGNKPAASCTQLTINKYHAVVAERFDNRAGTAAAYQYSNPDTAPHLLGSHAKLNSIKLAESCVSIRESALFSGFKKRPNWQPCDFTYPDFQLIFNSHFHDQDDVFIACLPGKCDFALYPGNYGFLPAEQSSLCNLTQNARKHPLATRSQFYAENFDARTEFARNLVILCHSDLRPVEGQATACHSRIENFAPFCAISNRPLSVFSQHKQISSLTLSNSDNRFNASSRIGSNISRDLHAAHGLNWTHGVFNKEPFTGSPLLRIAYNLSRSRMRLKLKLKHVNYVECRSEMVTLAHRPGLLLQIPVPVKLIASYKPLVLARPSRLPDPKPHEEPRPAYVARRSAMRFTSHRHAHYCRKTLKKIFDTRGLPAKVSQKCIFDSYCASHSLSEAQRNRDRFTSARPGNDAINVIYLRSMPFLMKLSAMDFTDIFLPEAQRRAAPSDVRFLSDLSPLPLRRRNTLKSLRFKLTRINDGYISAALRAQRRILSASSIFGLYSKGRQIKALETGNMPTAPVEKAYQPGYRGKLERFAITGSAPSQILNQMKLGMPISGQETGGSLTQKHFIFPSTWETVEKHHKCRIMLAPHPFGFPQFRLPIDSFRLVESAISFKFILPTPVSISISGACRFAREKVFLPPLSLKDPRRFLFPESRLFNSAGDHFFTSADYLHGKIKAPAQIDSFAHDWGLRKSGKLAVTIYHRLPAFRARQKTTDHFTFELAVGKHQQKHSPAPSPHFLMPRIHRLLLNFEKPCITTREIPELSLRRPVATCSPQKFSLMLQIPAAEAFRKPGYAFILNDRHKDKFAEKFSHANKCMNNGFNFRQRLRIYRFPYQPEHSRAELSVDFRTQEEPILDRLTFLDQINLEGAYLSFVWLSDQQKPVFHAQMNGNRSLTPQSFASNIAESSKQTFCEHSDRKEVRLDYEKSIYPQHIDESAFKKLVDVARLKLRKFKHIRSHITGYIATSLTPLTENFSPLEELNIPRRLSYDNLHWIILLRSFIELPMLAENYFNSKIKTFSRPHFSTLTANFSSDFCARNTPAAPGNLQPARKINSYALYTTSDEQLTLAVNPTFFCSNVPSPANFATTSVLSVAYDCAESGGELTMISSERPEYRRNIELYILHMAINIDDYDMYLGVSGRPLAGQSLSAADSCAEYRHPHLPEWLDLPQPLVHRKKMYI
ncbi:MAG: hypothetical protein A2W80_03950 [Candidatus Riflebacteria bacterium GWC2_50_8]|nr:MAG: hypothetical protein A2W80_03950 [Candidatus Riflebacteria bacterium GWC2_50_8]